MRNLNSTFTRVLVVWYAVFQIAHLVSLVRAGIALLSGTIFTFPAMPPREGWTMQASDFLMGMAIFDSVNILLSLIFVYGYFSLARWRLSFGVLTLTVQMYSALVFGFATAVSGAWSNYPVSYISITIAFLPVVILYFQFTLQALKARFYESSASGGGSDFF